MNEVVKHQEESQISFELPKNVIAEVLVNFLGKKEKLHYYKEIDFVLNINDVKQFYILLREKFKKENIDNEVYFEATVFYDDDTTRTLSSLKQIEEYFEPKNVIPQHLAMSWDIILHFPSSRTIETQKVELTFGKLTDRDCGYVSLIINHTNTMWGTEVQTLFINQLKKSFLLENKNISILKKLQNTFNSISMGTFSILVLLFMFYATIYNTTYNKEPNYYNEITDRDIEIIGKDDFIKSIYMSDIKTDNKILLVDIINNYSGEDLKALFNKSTNDKSLISVGNNYFSNREEINKVIEAVDTEYFEKKKRIDKWAETLMLFSLVTWIFTAILWLYKKYHISFHKNNTYITITDTSMKAYNDFTSNKSTVVFYGVTAVFFAVATGILTSAIYNFFKNII